MRANCIVGFCSQPATATMLKKKPHLICLTKTIVLHSFAPQKTSFKTGFQVLDCVWNVMAHAQKADFVFRRNGRVHLNRRGRQFSRLLAAEACASAVVMLDTPRSEVVWRVLATHSIRQFPPSFPLPCVTVCHHVSNALYLCPEWKSKRCVYWLQSSLE